MGHDQGRIADRLTTGFGIAVSVSAALCLLFSACVGESMFRVRGKIETIGQPHSCVMKVYRADTGNLAATMKVEPGFQKSVVIAPGSHRYYMTIECKGSSARCKSRTYELGSVEQYLNPIDLGVISLKGSE